MPEAIPGVSSSTPPSRSTGSPLLRVVGNAELDEQEARDTAMRLEAGTTTPPPADLSALVHERWNVMRDHRNTGENPIGERLLRAQRMFEGRYDPRKLQEIRKFGGSEVYSRLVAVKCRGATSLLRDVYLGADRPWAIEPRPDPPVPPEVRQTIVQLVTSETQNAQASGQPVTSDQAQMRLFDLMHAAQQAAKRNALAHAAVASDKVDSILKTGGFYDALAEFLVDLPLFPFAVMKGPVVRMVPKVSWESGRPDVQNRPQMFWERVDPFCFYWSPGAARISDAEIIEKKRLTRTDLNDLLGLPGYDQDAVRAALNDYDKGLRDWLDSTDTEAAQNVGRENPTTNRSNLIDAIEYHGNVQGHMLLEHGVDKSYIDDPDRDYAVQTWVVGQHTLKTQLNPSPRQRHPYYATSFEKVPGTVLGHGLPDLLEDWQESANATLRSLINNMSIASGPQVVVNTERLAPNVNADELYPWKRWHVVDDPMGQGREPVTFFQPGSNSQELVAVYSFITSTADDISAIPRYATGESLKGGAGRTASGLSMLMNNSSKVLQTVAANIDIDVMDPCLTSLYDMIMLTDQTGLLTGDEQINVNGVTVALQKETERQKQLQFLQITANPIDAPVIGELGRARVLRAVASNMGLPDDVVPDDSAIEQKIKAREQAQMMQARGLMPGGLVPQGGEGSAGGAPGGEGPGSEPEPGGSSPGAQAQGAQARQPAPPSHSDIAPPMNAFRQMAPAGGPNRGAGRYGP